MRRVLFLVMLAVAAAMAVVGCGSSSSGSSTDPLSGELSYLPAGSPLVVKVATDPNGPALTQARAFVAHFPAAGLGEAAVTSKLAQVGIDYQSDIRPLLGNPLVIGLATATPTGATSNYSLAVWTTKDAGKLTALVKKIPNLHAAGSHAGATLYQKNGSTSTVAVDGATVIIGSSAAIVDDAVDRHAHGGGLTTATYTEAFAGLPSNALIQVSGNVTGVLSQPSTAHARRVPWVAALHSYAVTMSADSGGLSVRYRLNTTGAPLTVQQVPVATATGTPAFAGNEPITMSIENPAHIVSFVEATERATNPGSYANFLRRQAAFRRATGVDLDSVAKLLTGNLIVASDTHVSMTRATLTDPRAGRSILAKLAHAPANAFGDGTKVRDVGGGFYVITTPSQTLTAGVVGDQFVGGKASVPQLRAFATAPTTPAAGAQGSVAFRISVAELVHLAAGSSVPQAANMILGSLGDITGWVAGSPAALAGAATLAVH